MSVVWSETSAAADLRENIHTWRLAGLQGDMLLAAFRELTTLSFLQKCSPTSVHNLRLFLFDNGVNVNMRPGSSSFYAVRALLPVPAAEILRDPAPTEEDAQAADDRIQATGSASGDPPSHIPHFSPHPDADSSNDILTAQASTVTPDVIASLAENPNIFPIQVVDEIANPSQVLPPPAPPILSQGQSRRNPSKSTVFRPTDHGLVAWTPPIHDAMPVHADHETEEPSEHRSRKLDRTDPKSKALSDLIKAYVGDKMKFSGDSYEESLLTTRRRFFTLCSMLDVNCHDACLAAHLPFTGTALEYYYDSIQAQAGDAEYVFDQMKTRFQTADVQDRALIKWQSTTFSSVRTSVHTDGYDTLRALYSAGQRIHRALPRAYEADTHLRDFLLRSCSDEPFYSRVPERPAPSSCDVLEQLAAAITRYENYVRLRSRSSNSTPRSFRNTQPSSIRFAEVPRIEQGNTEDEESEQLYVTRRVVPNTNIANATASAPHYSSPVLNPVDKQGVRKTCHGCGSIEHFLFECPTASRERKINFYDSISDRIQENDPVSDQIDGHELPIHFVAAVSDADTLLAIADPSVPFLDHVEYLGPCVDTGAEVSVAGARQYAAYLRRSSFPISESPAATETTPKKFRFGAQVFESTHVARIRFQVLPTMEQSPAFFEFSVHIIPLDCPVLLGLDVLLASHIHVDITRLVLRTDLWTAPLLVQSGHLFVKNSPDVLFTKKELTRMHVSLAHPSSDKLFRLLQVARPDETAPDTAALLKEINNSCRICTLYGPPPHRVRSSVPDNIRFNHHLVLDLFYLSGDVCLHVICKGTRFSATAFLPSKRAEVVWETFLRIWILVYLGSPCVLTVDQGTEVTAALFRRNCRAMGIQLIFAPIESHSSIGIVERFHSPIRHVFQKIQQGPDKDATKELRLALATKAVNDTIGIHGYVPTILVYGALPSIVLGEACSHAVQHQRMRMMHLARNAAEAYIAERRVREAEKHMSPSGEHELSPGDPC